MHWLRLKKRNDPNFEYVGDVVARWTGDDATYMAVHQRLRIRRGSAKLHKCVDCGLDAKQWSYEHNDPNEKSSELGPYSTDLNYYSPRCISCHKKFDLEVIRRGGACPEEQVRVSER
jgi:hypothetical protein